MPAFIVLQSTIKDEAQYEKYAQAAWPLMARFGAKLVSRRAKVEILEGEHDQRPVSMFEFPDMEAIHAFWNSPDYIPIKKLRDGVATLNVWAFPGAFLHAKIFLMITGDGGTGVITQRSEAVTIDGFRHQSPINR